jgi:hypothetical protein
VVNACMGNQIMSTVLAWENLKEMEILVRNAEDVGGCLLDKK